MEELNTTFKNVNNREYSIRLTVSLIHKFCRERHLKLEDIVPERLDLAQLLDLAYLGSRSTKMTALGETKEEFFEGIEGECFSQVQDCAVYAVVNFFLRTGNKEVRQIMEETVRRIREAEQAMQSLSNAVEQQSQSQDNGLGETSSDSVALAESTQQDAT